MNRTLLLLTGLAISAFIGYAIFEQPNKHRHDPTYSTHNYKHPNKAAQARRWEQSPALTVQAGDPRQAANYKQQRAGAAPQGGIVVPDQPAATIADRHYKTQNWMQAEPKPEVARKPAPGGPTTGN